MTTEKKSVSEDSTMTDYANLAFNPYAISTDDLTFSTFGSGETEKNPGKPMENGGFQPEPFVEVNPHYEDTSEVIKKAGLEGTGRRKKENIIYEGAGYKKKPKSEKRSEPPRIRTSNIPPRPPEDWSGISKNGTRWKLPFIILCILFVICLVGTALGVLAYFREEKCSCTNSSPQSLQQVQEETNYTSQIADVQNKLTQDIQKISDQLDSLNAAISSLTLEQMNQKTELTQTKETMNSEYQELKTAIQNINSTISTKLQNVDNDISSLGGDVKELRNISKQMGPRGFNGTQGPAGAQGLPGPQGEPGIGNISACIVGEEAQRTVVKSPNTDEITVFHEQTPGWKVISAVCSTRERYGAIHNVLSRSNNKYTCTCAGRSTYAGFQPSPNEKNEEFMECVMIYWECPVLT